MSVDDDTNSNLDRLKEMADDPESLSTKESEELREKLLYALSPDNPRDFILQFDWEERITAVSPSTVSFLGYDEDDLLGKKLSTLIYEKDLQLIEDLRDRVTKTGKDAIKSIRFKHKDGRLIEARAIALAAVILAVESQGNELG